ncbi:MAG: SUMF1/EgtB/PvdO family nonheme iron enzyme [Candidatus Aminicenantes bacterium]|nr:SUMF1/EgtB/PvdO family nonheme iron enzyme [Candidatus Aminicenantes bacterium]
MKKRNEKQIRKIIIWWIPTIMFFLSSTSLNLFNETQKKDQVQLSGIEFIYIPAGEFTMGSKKGEPDEKPEHKVSVRSIYMSKHEVTFMQYDLFCEKTGRKKPSDAGYARGNFKKMGLEVSPNDLKWGRGRLPVINVSWHDAKAYCFWLSKKTGKKIRLPYEVEWEYACRANTSESHYGNNINDIAWHNGNSNKQTHTVMKKKPNMFGLCDMLGNVWEWCEDWYDSCFYKKNNITPSGGTKKGCHRVVRGGSWINDPEVCTAHRRRGYHPAKSGSGLGFRLVLEISKKEITKACRSMRTLPRSGSTKVFRGAQGGGFSKKPPWSPKASNYGILKAGASNSEKSLEMRYNSGMRTSNYYESSETPQGPVIGAGTASYDHSISPLSDRSLPKSPNLESQEQKTAGRIPGKTLEASYTNTYYIWSFDGKLMAEYDHSGICVKEYIYFGNKLVAEYLPVEGKYYYHLSDQINSTRIVTDDAGSVVYSAAHGPFGDVQKTWVNTYDPKQKFSGKERETYSDLDYFGARYYDSHSYRFISVDPVRNRDEAIANPQLWNLYSYCRNNPITYLDPDGRDILDDIKKKAAGLMPKGMVPNTMMMEGWQENVQATDKAVKKAIKIAIVFGGAVIIIDLGRKN